MGEGLVGRVAYEMTLSLMKIGLRQDFLPCAALVEVGQIELLPDNRQLTLWSCCSTTIALWWATHSANRVETAEYKTVFLQWPL